MYDIKIVDDFFPQLLQKQIEVGFLDKDISWTYLQTISSKRGSKFKKGNILDSPGFVYKIDIENKENTRLMDNIKFAAKKHFDVDINKFIRLMLVYLPPNPLYEDGCFMMPHVDRKEPHKNILYYVVDNDAETIFYDQKWAPNNVFTYDNYDKLKVTKKILPKQGRAVYFDGLIYHSGNVSKLQKRLTLNINFI
jgi:hypothetical protein